MSITNITPNTISYVRESSKSINKDLKSEKDSKTEPQLKANSNNSSTNSESSGVVYETTHSDAVKEGNSKTQSLYKRDDKTIEKLKADAERRTSQLRGLVEKLLLKQGKTFDDSTDIYAFLRSGDYTVDEETKKQAQEDISEDGYWGVNQTSDRLVSFAKALTGGDPSKIGDMREAIKKGYEGATKAWGDELPSICKDTYDAAMKKLDEWESSTNNTENNTDK